MLVQGATLGALLAQQSVALSKEKQPVRISDDAAASGSPLAGSAQAVGRLVTRLQSIRQHCADALGPSIPEALMKELGTANIEALALIKELKDVSAHLQSQNDRCVLGGVGHVCAVQTFVDLTLGLDAACCAALQFWLLRHCVEKQLHSVASHT